MHQKKNVLISLNICPKRIVMKKKSSLTILLSSLAFIFSSPPQINPLIFYYNNISLPWALAFFLPEHLSCLSHHQTRWTMSVDNVDLKICLLGTSNFMIALTFFSWCHLKWSWDKFNSQSKFLQSLRTTSRCMV